MNVYLVTSVILSRLLNQTNRLRLWGKWKTCYTNTLTRVEFLRTVDRMRLSGSLSDGERVELQDRFKLVWGAAHRVILSQNLLDRASAAMPIVVGTLDALHLVTALLVTESRNVRLEFLTHDDQLAIGAQAMGFEVSGV